MIEAITAAYVFSVFTVGAIAFQLALALGMPWGEMAMGGRFPGRFPPTMRVAAVVQSLVLGFCAAVVVSRAGLMFEQFYELSRSVVWLVVGLCGVSVILKLITPSKKERILWAPITLVLFTTALVVAQS